MNFTPEQVDQIVQRVVAQLAPSAAAVPQATAARLDPASQAVVQIVDQVITQSLLAEACDGSRPVHIGPKAILTPSARDFVKQQGITIVRDSVSGKPSSALHWQVIVTKSNPQIAAAVESLPQLGITFDLRPSGLPVEAAEQAVNALCRGEAAQVVVFTDQPEHVACLANRNDRVRAAAAANVATVERVRIQMQANMIAIDPSSRNAHELRALLKAFKP